MINLSARSIFLLTVKLDESTKPRPEQAAQAATPLAQKTSPKRGQL
jgi:hypothetical protein